MLSTENGESKTNEPCQKANRDFSPWPPCSPWLHTFPKLQPVRFATLIAILVLQIGTSAQRHFVENLGQWPAQAHHKVSVEGGAMFLENDRFTFNLIDRGLYLELHGTPEMNSPVPVDIKGHAYQQMFLSTNANVKISGNKPQVTTYNFFLSGKIPK